MKKTCPSAFPCRLLVLPLLMIWLAALAPLALAQAAPRIGLVLGGGGARGAAHVGVLQKLQELRVPVDCVAGTSMGGLVAGAFSSGLTPAGMSWWMVQGMPARCAEPAAPAQASRSGPINLAR